MRVASNSRCASRLGISLMEVLISIGVVSIGLLGVVSLIPVASQQAESGARNDRTASVGRRSFREFNVRNFSNAGRPPLASRRWVQYLEPIGDYHPKRVFDGTDPTTSSFQPQAFCIDPRYVAAQQDPNGVGINKYYFSRAGHDAKFLVGPGSLGATDQPRLPIVSLASDSTLPFMSAEQSEEVFVFQDDLEFDPPANNGDPPTQIFLNGNAKRYAKGQFSWFMTVAPDSGGWWKLSTVICFQRNNLANTSGTALGPPTAVYGAIEPRSPDLSQPNPTSGYYTGGVNGGDLRIDWGGATSEREPRSRDWLLLGVNDLGDDGIEGNSDDMSRFGWYRVTSSSKAEGNFQDVTVVGDSWQYVFDSNDPDNVPDRQKITSVTWLPEVVAVYTKPVRIRNE